MIPKIKDGGKNLGLRPTLMARGRVLPVDFIMHFSQTSPAQVRRLGSSPNKLFRFFACAVRLTQPVEHRPLLRSRTLDAGKSAPEKSRIEAAFRDAGRQICSRHYLPQRGAPPSVPLIEENLPAGCS